MSKVAESDEQLTARYVQYFESKDIDHWWLSKVSYLQIIASFRLAHLSSFGGRHYLTSLNLVILVLL